MNVFPVSFCSGASFLLAFLLFFHPLRQNTRANRWLAVFICIMGTAFLDIYITQSSLVHSLLWFHRFIGCLQFLLGPSLYIAILYFVSPQRKIRPAQFLHLLPFLLYLGIELLYWRSGHSTRKTKLFAIYHTDFLVEDLVLLQAAIYFVFSYLRIRQHQFQLQKLLSSSRQVSLRWLQHFLLILLFALVIWMNDALFFIPFLLDLTPYVYTVSIFFLAWYSVQQPAIFNFKASELAEIEAIVESHEISEPEKPGRYSRERLQEMEAMLDKVMKGDKLYLDNELNLPALAAKLGMSTHDTSYLINQTKGTNFYTYVNGLRVEEAKRLLSGGDASRLNILGIAFSAGFNSKTTFNTVFKKMTGLSPSAYQKHQKNQ